jgi:hypothetical protein
VSQTKTTTTNVKSKTSEKNGNLKSYESLDFAKTSITSDTSTFTTIDRTIALMIYPDSLWASEQQKINGEDGWNEIVADNEYYHSLAIDTLEKLGIKVQFINTKKHLIKFTKLDKSEFCIDQNKMKDKWGLILFNMKTNPVFWNSTDIADAVNDIYEK